MKKILMFLILGTICIPNLAHTEEKNNFGYGSLGFVGGYPTIGGGYRMQHGYHGFDLSGRLLLTPNIRGLYLFYPKQRGVYLGAGFGYLWEGECLPHGSVTFDATVGYQWKTKKGRNLFFQFEGMTPFKETGLPVWPALTFGIGF